MVDADYEGLAFEYRDALIRGDAAWGAGSRDGDADAVRRWLDATVSRIVAVASAPFEYVETAVTAADGETDRDARVVAFTSRVVIVVSTKLRSDGGRYSADWRIDVLARNSLRALNSADGGDLDSEQDAGPRWSPLTAVYERDTVRLADTGSPRFADFYPGLVADLIH